jgi:hypothetical protein
MSVDCPRTIVHGARCPNTTTLPASDEAPLAELQR